MISWIQDGLRPSARRSSFARQIHISSQRHPRAAVGKRSTVRFLLDLHQHRMPTLEYDVVTMSLGPSEERGVPASKRLDPRSRLRIVCPLRHLVGHPEALNQDLTV